MERTFKWIEGLTRSAKDTAVSYTDINEESTARSFKKAVKDFCNKKAKELSHIRVSYTNKKNNLIDRWVQIPMGRKKHLLR